MLTIAVGLAVPFRVGDRKVTEVDVDVDVDFSGGSVAAPLVLTIFGCDCGCDFALGCVGTSRINQYVVILPLPYFLLKKKQKRRKNQS